MSSNLVTVFIPTYNRLNLLKKAVESVLIQGDNYVLHILDNASNDGTQEWLSKLASRNSRVRLTLRNKNLGAIVNIAEGFEKITTDYVVPLADDDELLPGFLSQALEIAQKDCEIGGVVFQTEVRSEGRCLFLSPSSCPNSVLQPLEHLDFWFEGGHYFSWSSILWRSSLLKQIDICIEFGKCGRFSDAWIQFLAFAQKPFFLVNKPGAVLNISNNQASKSFGLDFISAMAETLERISQKLKTDCKLESHSVEVYFNSILRHWNQMLYGECVRLSDQLNENEKTQILEEYLKHFRDKVFTQQFPLLPLFKECRLVHLELENIKKNNSVLHAKINYLLSINKVSQRGELINQKSIEKKLMTQDAKEVQKNSNSNSIYDQGGNNLNELIKNKRVLVFADEPGIGGWGMTLIAFCCPLLRQVGLSSVLNPSGRVR